MKAITLLSLFVIGNLLLLMVVQGCTNNNNGLPKKPNIIIIMADDVGISDIGCYGGEIQTPKLFR